MKASLKKFLTVILAMVMIVVAFPIQNVQTSIKKPAFYDSRKTITVGKSATLKVKNKIKSSSYKWSTSDRKTVTVTQKGKITGVKAGTATVVCKITVSKNKKYTLKCKITVKDSAKYKYPQLNELKDTDHFLFSAIEHIFVGEINSAGEAVGYHYEGIEGSSGAVIQGTQSKENAFGVYRAKVEVQGIAKTSNGGFSTFFPKRMSPQEVVDSINTAYDNRVFQSGNIYYGYSSDGIKILMYLTSDNKIISAFPEY